MRTNLKKSILAALCLFCLLALTACGNGGGGGGIADLDGDGIADSADNCPAIANADQADSDGDGIGNVCEAVIADADGDGVADSVDNCPETANANQADTDGDGVGNVCDPTPQADVFNWTGNTRLTTIATNGLLANDLPGSVITAVNTATTLGTINVTQATGAFTYDPPVGLQNATDTFTYTVAGETATVTINLAERIWYVNGVLANGNGTLASPFNTLVQAQAASDVNDTIFVYNGTPAVPADIGQNLGITLQDGQKLRGQGLRLSYNGVPIVDPLANAPLISNAGLPVPGNIPVVLLANGNEVAGLTINAAFNEGILALGGSGHFIHDNAITFGAGDEGIRLLNVTGNNTVLVNTITGSPSRGILLANNEDLAGNPVAATPIVATVTMSRNTIGNTAREGIRVNLDGAGTDVTLNLLTNAITDSGIAQASQGINVNGLGAAKITSHISRNTIINSRDKATELTAAGTSQVAAFVANNALALSQAAPPEFRALKSAASASICLELLNNFNVTANSTFRVDNTIGGIFQFFERANDTLAVRVPLITDVAEGTCAIPLDGVALFKANCTACHTGNGMAQLAKPELPLVRDITGRTADVINAQFTTTPNLSMISIFVRTGRLTLTQQEITAIAAALAPAP